MNAVYALANQLLSELAPACERIELAGSIRRRKPDPKDIELCAIPRLVEQAQAGLFGDQISLGAINPLEDLVQMLVAGDEWEFDPVTRRNGNKYKRLRHRRMLNRDDEPLCVDLFIPTRRTWGVIFTLRTGPGEFSKALVSHAINKGTFVEEGLLHRHRRQYGKEHKPLPCPRGESCSLIAETPEETDFFAALQVPYLDPEERTLARLMASLRA